MLENASAKEEQLPGLKPTVISHAYAALKGRSSTIVQTFMSSQRLSGHEQSALVQIFVSSPPRALRCLRGGANRERRSP
jgi:hypothetical protein